MDNEKTVLIIAVLAAVFAVAFVGYGFLLNSGVMGAGVMGPGNMASGQLEHSDEQFEQMAAAELDDTCAVPDGYTEQTWKEHMSHHPDRYEGCDF